MAFTFTAGLSDNVSIVRFHIGDTNERGHYLEDETIQYYITNGGVGTAVIACIRYIITQLSTPDFRQDWLSVSKGEARKGFETLLKIKQQEFGISAATAASTISLPHRADSHEADSEGVYVTVDGAP
jgi:hypothetical protein